jgi:hypothetical protein
VSLGGDVSRRNLVTVGVEKDTTALGRHVASFLAWRGMYERALGPILEECLCNSRAAVTFSVPMLRPRRPARDVVRLFELVVPAHLDRHRAEIAV